MENRSEVSNIKKYISNINKYDIKNPTMLSVAAQQAEAFIKLLEINKEYCAKILAEEHYADNKDDGIVFMNSHIEELNVIIKRIIKDIGEV